MMQKGNTYMSYTRKNPITGKDVIPADLLADAKSGTPWYNLTPAEQTEFQGLSPALQDKLSGINHAAMIGAAAVDSTDNSVQPEDCDDFLNRLFTKQQKAA